MSIINVQNLSFRYDSYGENIFENVTLQLDTDWRLGLTGRNGRGKSTFLHLLAGRYPYSGAITASVTFDYFPFPAGASEEETRHVMRQMIAPFALWETEMEQYMQTDLDRYAQALENYQAHDGYTIEQQMEKELGKLRVSPLILEQPFATLSGGEKVKVQLAALFLKKNNFLLLDEPTNHLDSEGRDAISAYLASKSGFILVSHDRALLDAVTDHTLSINRANIELQKGNFSSWMQNKQQQDEFEQARNRHLKSEIDKLGTAARRTAGWSDRIESSKTGAADKGYIGHKSAKMMQRAKSVEQRRQRAVEEKRKLLKNIETAEELKLHPIDYPKRFLAEAIDLSVSYGDKPLFSKLSFVIEPRERIALSGKNGSGKTSLIRLLLGESVPHNGILRCGSNLKISYIPQDTSFLMGSLKELSQTAGIDESLFKAILRKLDFSREQFDKSMKDYSEGQKKKVLLAKSLCEQAHLYIWDEPLNYIDVFSRMQIEQLIIEYRPTLLFVEHDAYFENRIATKKIKL